MAEENKETSKTGEKVKVFLKMLIGAVVFLVGIYLCIKWWPSLLQLIKGCLGPMLMLIGFVVIAIARE